MKEKITFILILFCISSHSQGRNYDQELFDYLYEKNIFKSIDFYFQYKDSLQHSFNHDYYRVFTDMYLNRVDSAVLHLPQFFDKYSAQYSESVLSDATKFSLLEDLLNTTIASENYDAVLKTLDYMKEFVNSSTWLAGVKDTLTSQLESLHNEYQKWGNFPFQLIDHSEDGCSILDLEMNVLPKIGVKLNELTIPAVFDTGSNFSITMDKKMAQQIGVNILEDYQSKTLNYIELNSAWGVLDSLQIGSIQFKNIPVYILEESMFSRCLSDSLPEETIEKVDSITNQIQVFLGLPLISKLNHIQLDMENRKMIISLNKNNPTIESPNLFINRFLYINSTINNLDLVLLFDTGGQFGNTMMINPYFYQENSSHFEIEEQTEKIAHCGLNGLLTSSLSKIKQLDLRIGSNRVNLNNEAIVVSSIEEENDTAKEHIKKNWLGCDFFKKIKSLTFDFKSMHMDFITKNTERRCQ